MKVAAVQMDIKIFEKERNLQYILSQLEQAARTGAKLVVYPECALTGYCFNSQEEAAPLAEEVPGPSTERILASARALDCTVVVGMIERVGDRVFNAAAVVTPQSILGTFRKIHLPGLGIDWLAEPGNKGFPVFETPHAKVGVVICYDCSFPESARILKLQGAQILAVATNWPNPNETWKHVPTVRAFENHMHVVVSDRVGEERTFGFAGHSQIIDCNGTKLVEADGREQTILYAEVNPAEADNDHVVMRPGVWEIRRVADRRPEVYSAITERMTASSAATRRAAGSR